MPALNRGSSERELQKLIELFLRAETAIINEIGRLRSQGLADYHAVAALERVQAILRKLESDSWEYVPRMIEAQFYVRHPEARKPLEEPETPEKHLRAYQNARTLTAEQTDIVQRLTMNLMGQITEASAVALAGLQNTLIGRTEPDVFRRVGLEQTTLRLAQGRGTYKALPGFVEALRREGVTAFVDKAGRRWSLHTYGAMVSRTTSRQAQVLSLLTSDPEQDLYKISTHGTTCPLCAPYEGRVYSRSGADPDFPPLAAAFGKMDPGGPDDLSNTWLNIHPNCLHTIVPWTAAGRTPEEIRKIKDFSNPKKNPFDRDPRTEAQREAYRKKELARRHWAEDYRQWQRYRETLGDQCPKTFTTFRKHKLAGDEKYKTWLREYRGTNAAQNKFRIESLQSIPYNEDKKSAVQALIRSDAIPKNLNVGHQNKHLKESGHYIAGKSYLYGNLETAQSLVNQYHGTGMPVFTHKGEWAHKEVVVQDKVIGVDINPKTGESSETRKFTIQYGKRGTHIVPAEEF